MLLRARADLAVVGAAWLLLLCATTVLSATVLYADTVATGGLRQAIVATDPDTRSVDVRVPASAALVGSLDDRVRPQLVAALEPAGGRVVRTTRSDPLAAPQADPSGARDLVVAEAFEDVPSHARLTAGRWPAAGAQPVEVALSDAAAAALEVAVGDRRSYVNIRDASSATEFQIVGTWQPLDADDAYWLGDPLELTGAQVGPTGAVTRGPLVVADADLATGDISRSVTAEWRGLVPVDGVTPANAPTLSSAITALRARLSGSLPALARPTITTGLPSLLDDLDRSISASRSSILLLGLQFAALAVYAAILVAGMLLERRRAETALLRSRGAAARHLIAMSLVEALVLAVPVVVFAPLLAFGVVRLVGGLGPAPVPTLAPSAAIIVPPVVVAAIAGVGWLLALAVPTLTSAAAEAGIRASFGRPIARTLAQRAGLDLVLVVVAAIGLWQLRLYGAPLTRTAGGNLVADPLLVAAPAITLVAGAIVAIRVLPRLAEVGERLLVRAHGLLAPLGSRQLARRPLRYTRSALLLVLAVALGTFAAGYAATWSRSQADQAAYRVVADVRAVANDYGRLPDWATAAAVTAAPGVRAALPARVDAATLGRTVPDLQLAAVDASRLRDIATGTPGAADAGAALATLARSRPEAGLALPRRPRRIRVTIDAALEPVDPLAGEAAPPVDFTTERAIDATAVLVDGTGTLVRVDLGSAVLRGRGQQLVTPLSLDAGGRALAATPPLRLVALDLALDLPIDSAAVGSFQLMAIATSDDATGESWTPVAVDPSTGSQWLRTDANGTEPYVSPGGDPGTIEIPRSQPVVGEFEGPPTSFRLLAPVPSSGPLPAVASRPFLDRSGAAVGDTITIDRGGHPLDVRLAAAADLFAPLDPRTPFLVVDAATLALDRFLATDEVARPTEWWIASTDPAGTRDALLAPPFAAKQVVAREELRRSLLTDPVSLGVIGALALGAVAALVFAAIGFLVNTTVATAERSGELAVLRALGVSRRQLIGWLLAESAVLLVVGVVGGAALGVLLAEVVLPSTALTATGLPPVPPPVVVVPVEALVPIEIGALGLLLAAIVLAARQVPPIHVGSALRAADE